MGSFSLSALIVTAFWKDDNREKDAKSPGLSSGASRKERGYNEMKKKLSLASVMIKDSCKQTKQKLLQKN